TRDARADLQHPPQVPRLVLLGLIWQGGTWTDETHVALQDIEDLRQLVEAGFADDTPDARNTRIRAHLVQGTVLVALVDLIELPLDQVGGVFAMYPIVRVGAHR